MTAMATDIHDQLLSHVSDLRGYARKVCVNGPNTDDLVQEALLLAWSKRETLRDASRMKPWLFAILRNVFLTHLRRGKFEVEDVDGAMAMQQSVPPRQHSDVELSEIGQALSALPIEERTAVGQVLFERLSYREAAERCGCPIGTIKSRVHRGRARLLALLGEDAIPSEAHVY